MEIKPAAMRTLLVILLVTSEVEVKLRGKGFSRILEMKGR